MGTFHAQKPFYDLAETVLVVREMGFDTVTASTIKKAAYYGDKPLKRNKIGGRIYFSLEDITHWIRRCKIAD